MDFFDFLMLMQKVKIFHCYSKKKCILTNVVHAAASGGGDSTVACTSEFRVKKNLVVSKKNPIFASVIQINKKMKKFIAVFAMAVIAFVSINAESKFKDGIYESTGFGTKSYKATELGLSLSVINGYPLDMAVEDMDGFMLGLDAVFSNFYVGAAGGNEIFSGKVGYAFRLKFFDSSKQFSAVVSPYCGIVVYDGDTGINYGVHGIFKLTNTFGLSMDMSPLALSVGFSIAF